MTTDQDIARLEREIAGFPQRLRDAERQISKDRRLNTPKDFKGGEPEEFAAVTARADKAFQVSRIVPPPPSDYENAELYALRLGKTLLPSARLSKDQMKQLEQCDSGHAMLQVVADAALKQACLAPDLREIKQSDQSGRMISTFVGAKSSWMNRFKVPPQESPLYVNGVPRGIRTIVT